MDDLIERHLISDPTTGKASGLPRVAVIVPSGDTVQAGFAMSLSRLCCASLPIDLALINVKSSVIATARNNGVALAQSTRCDFLLFLDSDMEFPPGALWRLLSHNVDIVGATYRKRVPPYEMIGCATEQQPNDAPAGLLEMKRLPTGCLLIRMSVFDRLKRPYFRFENDEEEGVVVGEDFVFCDRARRAGYRIWCDDDLSLQLGHIGQQTVLTANDPPALAA